MHKVNKRAVVFIDILGFKNLINTIPLHKLSQKYELMIKQTDAMNRPFLLEGLPTLFPDHTKQKEWCKRYIFSDSIILIALEDDSLSFLKLLVYSWRFFQSLLGMQLPARGGIAFGELYENKENNIVLGKALVEAYTLEQKQQWIGVAIKNEIRDQYPDLFKLFMDNQNVLGNIFLNYPVPFKDGSTKMMHTLNWRFNLIVDKGTRWLFPEAKDNSAKEKRRNTLEYAKHIVNSGRIYASNQESLPVELRAMFIGATEPPFAHGDEL